MKNNTQKGFIIPLFIVIVVLAVAVGAYMIGKSQTKDTVIPSSSNNTSTTVSNNTENNPELTQPQAQQLVLSTWGGCTPDTCGSVTVTVQKNDSGQYIVIAVYDQLRDDSTGRQRKEAVAIYQSGNWSLGLPVVTFSCQKDRGHADFSSVPCI